MANKKIHVLGGGTVFDVRSHLALCAPAFGNTARQMTGIFKMLKGEHSRVEYTKEGHPRIHKEGAQHHMDVVLHLTELAQPYVNKGQKLRTNEDVEALVDTLIADPTTKIIIFNVAMCDFEGKVGYEAGKYAPRLSTREPGFKSINLTPAPKVIQKIRAKRKDILLVGFKTTTGATEDEQYIAGLNLLKEASCNLVLANDVQTRLNMIITPEEARYHVTEDRDEVLRNLADMALLRSHLTFTRSTVVDAEPVPWDSEEVFPTLRTVVNWCIEQGAYKPFRGATVGHFACKIGEQEFLTSRRKTNFNDLPELGLVRVKTDGPDSVIAYGFKPSVGGQSQRLVFEAHAGLDCIVHFHCPLKAESRDAIPVRSQREYECGSHECGKNTSDGLAEFGNLKAVMLDQHGPNIVFNHGIDPQEVIDFIEANFDLMGKTGGYVDLGQILMEAK